MARMKAEIRIGQRIKSFEFGTAGFSEVVAVGPNSITIRRIGSGSTIKIPRSMTKSLKFV